MNPKEACVKAQNLWNTGEYAKAIRFAWLNIGHWSSWKASGFRPDLSPMPTDHPDWHVLCGDCPRSAAVETKNWHILDLAAAVKDYDAIWDLANRICPILGDVQAVELCELIPEVADHLTEWCREGFFNTDITTEIAMYIAENARSEDVRKRAKNAAVYRSIELTI